MKKATWNYYLAQTWNTYLPPIRPYLEELLIIKQQITEFITNNSLKPKVLILGSTPELRDILYEFDIQPTVIDYRKENYMVMSELLNKKGVDRFVEMNWLDMAFDKEFDIILSEAAFNVVPYNTIKELYKRIYKSLKDDGLLIAKNWVRFSNVCPSLDKLIKEYRSCNKNIGFYSYTCIPLMLCFYDYSMECIKVRTLSHKCKELFRNNLINELEWESISIHNYEEVDLHIYIPLIHDFINDINPHFEISKIFDIKIAHSEYHPLFILKKI